MDKVYILLPVHNRYKITENFIASLKSQTYHNYHLVLIDDGSTDGTADMVNRQIQSLTVLHGKGTWWWAGSLQQGISWLRKVVHPQDIVLFINDDTTFEASFLEKAVDLLSHHPNTLIQAYGFDSTTNQLIEPGVNFNLRNLKFFPTENSSEVNCLSTRSLFLRWKDLDAIGGFHPLLLPHYLSDYEFTIRAYNKGFNLYAAPNLKIKFSLNTSGYSEFKDCNFTTLIKRFFSKKHPANPVYWSFFIILACPKIWIPINLIRIWKQTAASLIKELRYRIVL